MTTYFHATFTAADGTNAAAGSYAPESGYGLQVLSPAAMAVRSNRLRLTSPTFSFGAHYARFKATNATDGGFPSNATVVQLKVDFLTGGYNQEVYAAARIQDDGSAAYLLGLRDGRWRMYRVVPGFEYWQPEVASIAAPPDPTGQHVLTLVTYDVGADTHVVGQVDGVEVGHFIEEPDWGNFGLTPLQTGLPGVMLMDYDMPGATDGAWLTEATVTDIPTGPDHLVYVRQPAGILPATNFGVLPKMRLASIIGAAVTGVADALTFAKVSGPGVLTGTPTQAISTVTGEGTFAGPLQVSLPGDYVFSVSDSLGLLPVQSLSIHVPATASAQFQAPLLNANMDDAGTEPLDLATWELRSGAPPTLITDADTGVVGASGIFGQYALNNFGGISTLIPPGKATAVASITPGYLVLKQAGTGTVLSRFTAGPSGRVVTPASLTSGERVQFDWLAFVDSSQIITVATVVSGGMSFGGVMDGPAELPRIYQDRTLHPRTTGTLRTVGYSGRDFTDLQDAIDAAGSDDWLQVDPDYDYTPAGGGQLIARAKGALAKPIVIIAAALPSAAGTRATPTMHAAVVSPKIRLANTLAGIMCEDGADNYRFVGIEVCPAASSPPASVFIPVCFGPDPGQPVFGQGANAAAIPTRMFLDRCYVHGGNATDVIHGVAMNAHSCAVFDSWVSEIHSETNDCQAIVAWMSNGPLTIVNNYLEALCENLIIGGAESWWGFQPADIEIRYNTIRKDPAWHGVRFDTKTLVEGKTGVRVLVEGNDIAYNWNGTIPWYGASITFKTVNQGQETNVPHWRLSDLTVRYNRVQYSGCLFNFHPMPEYYPATSAARVSCHDNLGYHMGDFPATDVHAWAIYMGAGPRYAPTDVEVAHNTFVASAGAMGRFLYWDGDDTVLKTVRTIVRDNLVATMDDFPLNGAGHGYVDDFIAAWWGPTSDLRGNVIAAGITGPRASAQALQNTWLDNTTDPTHPELHFVDLAGGNLRLVPGSPYSATASVPRVGGDGLDAGANIDAVEAALAGGSPFVPPPDQTPTAIVVTSAPSVARPGVPFAIVAEVLDAVGVLCTTGPGATASMTIAVTAGTAHFTGGSTTVAASGGVVPFSGLTLAGAIAETVTLTLSVLGLSISFPLAFEAFDGSPSVPDAMSIIQNSTSPILFYMSDSTDSTGRTPKTGLSPTVTLSKAGSAFAAAAGTVAEISGGWYKLTPTTADTGTLGDLGIHASAAGADDWNDLRRVVTGVRTDLATELADIVSSLDAPVSSRATPAQTAAAVLANPSYKLVTDGAGHVALAAASITAFLDSVIETNGGATLTMRQALSAGASLALGAISGITDGVGTEVVTLRSATGQIIATFLTDGVGNRTPTITYPA